MAIPSGGSVTRSFNWLIDGLLQGNSWTFASGPRVITYSLNQTGYGGSWSVQMAAATDAAFAAWEAVANVDFQRVTSGTYSWQSSADIAVGLTGSQQSTRWGSIGYANFPNSADNDYARTDLGFLLGQNFSAANYAHPEGDIYLDNYAGDYDYLDPGGYGLTVILHEIGHALGLKHPHDDGGTGFPTFAELGITSMDVDQYTVMSYNFEFPYIDIGNPETPMVLDILAIQYIYGANMTYHTGNDIYRFEYGRCYAIWDAGGNDTIDASSMNGVNLNLEAGRTNIDKDYYATVGIAFGVTIENAIGSKYDDIIYGNAASNVIRGNDGHDFLFGDDGNDTIYGDRSGSADLGVTENDYLDGGAGADILIGGRGNDGYNVDELGDQVIEQAGQGIDVVETSISYSLTANLENITLLGDAAINATGNDANNKIQGNQSNNILTGHAGNDTILDWGSTDEDQMLGGAGDDYYFVDSLNEHVIEFADEGSDTIQTSLLKYTLGDHVENLVCTGSSGPIIALGNALDNTIKNDSTGNDILDGGAGADDYWGSWGSDTYYIDNSYDEIINEITSYAGVDEAIISASLTILSLTGIEIFTLVGSGNISAYGNQLANTITGNSGANYLDGGWGNDTIIFGDKDYADGDLDNDTYVFDATPSDHRLTAVITNFEYLETLTFSTLLPLDGATSSILWPIDLGDGATTGLNELEYASNGFQTYLSFGLDDVAGADFTITLQNHVKVEDLQVKAEGNTITITNLDVPNKAPTDITLSVPSMKISEDMPVGTVIGTLGATDPDEKASHTFSLLDAPLSSFSIVDGNKLVLAKALDADTVVKYTNALIRVTDSEGAWYSEGFQFEITDANDNAPVITSGSGAASYAFSHVENDAFVASISATDVDKNTALSYSIVGGADKDLFTIDSVLGHVSFVKAPDFEAPADSNGDNVYVLDVQVSDGKFADTQSLKITVSDQSGATINGTAGNDTINGTSLALGRTTNEHDKISGLGGNDSIQALIGNDWLDGGTGNDTLRGGAGNDTYVVDAVGDKIDEEGNTDSADLVRSTISVDLNALGGGAIERAILRGTAAVNATGNGAANSLTGNAAANILDGRGGADAMADGDGADTYIVDNARDKVTETNAATAGGIDTVKSSVSFALGANIEKLTLTGAGNVNGTGNSLNNTLLGNDGGNRLDGGAGNDSMTGGKGNDTYVVNAAGDVINETIAAGGGIDTVESAIAFSLASRVNVENLTLIGSASNATGNALANILTGNSLANILDGGTGADALRGGVGNDLYLVDNAGDIVDEQANTDTGDEVKSATIRFAAIAGIENYTYTGAAAWTFGGTAANNRISGGSAADNLNGAGGNDTILGNGGNDVLIGGAGNDWLDGGAGNETTKGGSGNDTYVVNAAGDKIDEEGNADLADQVRSTITINLAIVGAGLVENATLLGVAAISATGNTSANRLIGNDAANTLDGAGGADILEGGKGADTYIVNDPGDQVIETTSSATGGIDVVKSSVSFSLGANLENLTLTGSGNSNGVGNTLNNVLVGNEGNNTLDGGAGNDTMTGGKGSDTYVVNAAGDVVNETIAAGGGTDTVRSSITYTLATHVNVENLTLTGSSNINGTGNALNNRLTGNGVNNTLDGGAGNDIIAGGAGNDTLLGGIGNDTLAGASGADKLTGGSGRDAFDYDHLADVGDTITDFALGAGGDVLDLRDLLDEIGYAGSDPFADSFLEFSKSGANTLVAIDMDGIGGSSAANLVTLLNVTLTAANTDNYLV